MSDAADDVMLQDLLLGKLSDEEAADYLAGLNDASRLDELASRIGASDTLLASIQTLANDPPAAPSPQVKALIDRVQQQIAARSNASSPTIDPSSSQNTDAPAEKADLKKAAAGRTLGGYRIIKQLGAGGMGIVYLAEDPQLRREVALKVMRPEAAASAQARARFLREARAAARIEHDHIVTVHQVGEAEGAPFLVMPLLRGETLDERLQREPKPPLTEILRIGREIAEGLAAAHDGGLIHRDIKPANVWLEGKKSRVKLLDFGLARGGETDDRITQSGTVVGTPSYMAPEQAAGQTVDARGDLFSLGCILYQMTTGNRPFTGLNLMAVLHSLANHTPPPPAEVEPSVPPALSHLIARLLSKSPDARPGSAHQVAEELAALERAVSRPAVADTLQ